MVWDASPDGIDAVNAFDYIIVGAGSAGCVMANRLSADGRSRVLAIFNAAVANFNLRRNDVARRWAEQVENDPQIGERAKEILERTR